MIAIGYGSWRLQVYDSYKGPIFMNIIRQYDKQDLIYAPLGFSDMYSTFC